MAYVTAALAAACVAVVCGQLTGVPNENWNYVEVRKDAHMFWWNYNTGDNYLDRPLVIWLQGGPGASGVGYGNFGEMGPLDEQLNPRNTTWLKVANLLFVDSPVGSGYSYVTNETAYTTNVDQISADLLVMLKGFLKDLPEYKRIPIYIFSESYGGKVAISFAEVLHEAISKREIDCIFNGVAMGDSWISPTDSVDTWGEYLFAQSIVDEVGRDKIYFMANKTKQALAQNEFQLSEQYWGMTENVVETVSGGVDFYNINYWRSINAQNGIHLTPRFGPASKLRSFKRHVENLHTGDLYSLMNNEIRAKLKIIPKEVKWGGQRREVFVKQHGDFMVPVIDIVDRVLKLKDLQVIVYTGQLDLICNTIGTERWVQKLKWTGLPCYNRAPRRYLLNSEHRIMAYHKQFEQFSFFWILQAGHMVPLDAGEASLKMLQMVFDKSV